MIVYDDHDYEAILKKGYRPPWEFNRQNPDRDKNLWAKVKQMDVVLTPEEYYKKHPEETEEGKAKKRLIEIVGAFAAAKRQAYEPEVFDEDDELTDEEYDNIYYGQVDETSDETYDGDFNPYAYNIYDDALPDGFNSWPEGVKSAWRKKHKIGER